MITKPSWFLPIGLGFFALSLVAVATDGFVAIYAVAFGSWAQAQVFADLGVALLFTLMWLRQDAKSLDLAWWPWFVATPFLGSIAPLTYVVYRYWVQNR